MSTKTERAQAKSLRCPNCHALPYQLCARSHTWDGMCIERLTLANKLHQIVWKNRHGHATTSAH